MQSNYSVPAGTTPTPELYPVEKGVYAGGTLPASAGSPPTEGPPTHLLGDALDSFAPPRKPMQRFLAAVAVALFALMLVAACLGVGLMVLTSAPVADQLTVLTHPEASETELEVLRGIKLATIRYVTTMSFEEGLSFERLFVGLTLTEINAWPDQPYTEAEVSHLQDVRVLFRWALLSTYFLLLVNTIIISLTKQTAFARRSLLIAGIVCLVLPLGVGVALLLDFGQSFVLFHRILFPQGNWSFPEHSLLVTVSPERFWQLCGFVWMGILLLLGAVMIVFSRFCGEKYTWTGQKRDKRRS
jgi:integral membrane protein (TIGR01906 family)